MVSGLDLSVAAGLVGDALRSFGSEPALRKAALSIARASGFDDRVSPNSGWNVHNPWKWLASVATEARRTGDFLLAAQVSLFVTMWNEAFLSGHDASGWREVGMDRPDVTSFVEIVTAGLSSLWHVPSPTIVVNAPTGAACIEDVARAAAKILLQLSREIAVDQRALRCARDVVVRHNIQLT